MRNQIKNSHSQFCYKMVNESAELHRFMLIHGPTKDGIGRIGFSQKVVKNEEILTASHLYLPSEPATMPSEHWQTSTTSVLLQPVPIPYILATMSSDHQVI